MLYDVCEDYAEALKAFLDSVRNQAQLRQPNQPREMKRIFTVQKVADQLGVTGSYITRRSKEKDFPTPLFDDSGRRLGWDYPAFLEIRKYLKHYPDLSKAVKTAVCAVANFKGGSAKTSTTIILAQGMALRGYKVLILDLDPQASASYQFTSKEKSKENPLEFGLGDYMLADYADAIFKTQIDGVDEDGQVQFFETDMPDPKEITKSTQWCNIDLVESDPMLHLVEIGLARKGDNFLFWEILNQIIDFVKKPYDLVLLDFPPSLNYSSINGLFAANCVIVPTPPELVDLHSTYEFLDAIAQTFAYYENHEFSKPVDLDFLKILITKAYTEGFPAELEGGLKLMLGDRVMTNSVLGSKVFSNTTAAYTTPFEVHKYKDLQTYKRCIDNLDSVVTEFENLLKEKVWRITDDQA